jgi:uncharacterized protein (DUF58 family)
LARLCAHGPVFHPRIRSGHEPPLLPRARHERVDEIHQRRDTRFDFARRVAGTLAHLLVHQGDATGLCLFSKQSCTTFRRAHATALRQNARHARRRKPQGETSLVRTLHELAERIRQRSLVIIISDLFTEVPELLDASSISAFYKHDVAVFHLLDRQEFDFDFTRPCASWTWKVART